MAANRLFEAIENGGGEEEASEEEAGYYSDDDVPHLEEVDLSTGKVVPYDPRYTDGGGGTGETAFAWPVELRGYQPTRLPSDGPVFHAELAVQGDDYSGVQMYRDFLSVCRHRFFNARGYPKAPFLGGVAVT
jgi:hypothetical protein